MNALMTIASYKGWEVVLDANSIVSIHFGHGMWIANYASAYEAIKAEVKDPEIRGELLRQWHDYMNGGSL